MATELLTGKFALEERQRQHAKAKLPLGNHSQQVSEMKMDNPIESHREYFVENMNVLQGGKEDVIVKFSV
ncbi:hypothetical protein JOB18_031597 [Solea senegalensis]|uniref:Uncharacterized protein n=1 Tax=Solea senegalensis TaxID=28829 RepID=A0AAV6QP72_SOLSE|nr:hypothetical protein JOB18_031597 [Solea senegalensis]